MSTTAQKTDIKDEIPEVAARRLKKREFDRKAQRAARERTKSRIAYLEELVEHLSHKDVNAEVSRLMEQLLQTTQERDKLISFLASLETTIRHHTDAFSAQSKGSSISVVGAMQALSELPEDIKSFDQTQAPEEGATSPSYRDEYATPDTCISLPPTDFGWGFDTPEIPIIASKSAAMPYPRHTVQNCDEIQPTPTILPRRDTGLSQEASSPVNNFIIPQSPQPCHCSTVIQVNQRNLNPNIWRQINHALGKPVELSQLAIEAEDRASQDTPVRAIVEGWDSVERAGMMTDSWRKLRMVDDLCFSKPGVRERFVFSQHRYCSNLFWQLFRANLTILWQSGFNDCFIKRNQITDQ
ncbi:hypothetical protein HYQ45_012936 [Verticillium longisporum]|uniref:BZIP domain-containing protein n=1 Tax=Verticillium longisporum TaxID=100787 RepID=A0A8I3ANC9_VERLO|nr:hypothetical protein HYQ45_012936 [Verticillium longisporum]